MSLLRGPFQIKFGDNVIDNISEVSVDYSVDSEDYPTVQGVTRTIEGAHKATVTLQLLESDIPVLAVLLPQYFVPNGGIMSTGETVNNAAGAIDIAAASCNTDPVYNNLDIISCGNPGNVMRFVNCRTQIDSVDLDDKVGQVSVIFIGEPQGGEAALQIFKEGTIHVVS